MNSNRFRIRRVLLGAVAGALVLLAPTAAGAETLTFGPPLDVPATLDTAENLNYEGSNIALPGSVFHINHDGADTAIWNTALPVGSATVPTGGQIVSFSLEGCARQPEGDPAPLTQIHFQEIVPLPSGGFQVASTSQAFEIPVCGAGGASGSTVSSYTPVHFCVNQGDYVDFNDEGGFAGGSPPAYPAGVPYMVIGSVAGATMYSFVRDGGTGNGATFSPADRTSHDGFAENREHELMLQSILATGPDAANDCPGGTKGAPAPTSGYGSHAPVAELQVKRQTDGINHRGVASIALYCHAPAGCRGTLTLTALIGHGRGRSLRHAFALPGATTTHLSLKLPHTLMVLARKHRKGVPMRLQATAGSAKVTQTVVLRIF